MKVIFVITALLYSIQINAAPSPDLENPLARRESSRNLYCGGDRKIIIQTGFRGYLGGGTKVFNCNTSESSQECCDSCGKNLESNGYLEKWYIYIHI